MHHIINRDQQQSQQHTTHGQNNKLQQSQGIDSMGDVIDEDDEDDDEEDNTMNINNNGNNMMMMNMNTDIDDNNNNSQIALEYQREMATAANAAAIIPDKEGFIPVKKKGKKGKK